MYNLLGKRHNLMMGSLLCYFHPFPFIIPECNKPNTSAETFSSKRKNLPEICTRYESNTFIYFFTFPFMFLVKFEPCSFSKLISRILKPTLLRRPDFRHYGFVRSNRFLSAGFVIVSNLKYRE